MNRLSQAFATYVCVCSLVVGCGDDTDGTGGTGGTAGMAGTGGTGGSGGNAGTGGTAGTGRTGGAGGIGSEAGTGGMAGMGGAGAVGGEAGTGGIGGASGAGGAAGAGGVGGASMDACNNTADRQVITNAGEGDFDIGRQEVEDKASDCIVDCAAEFERLIIADGRDDVLNQEAATCIKACTANEYSLSAQCLTCYGSSVACNVASCIEPCRVDSSSQSCINCRCNLLGSGNSNNENCVGGFEECSGIPSTTVCP